MRHPGVLYPTSQNRFWQSMSCRLRPRRPLNWRPRRAKCSSWWSAMYRMMSDSIPSAARPKHCRDPVPGSRTRHHELHLVIIEHRRVVQVDQVLVSKKLPIAGYERSTSNAARNEPADLTFPVTPVDIISSSSRR